MIWNAVLRLIEWLGHNTWQPLFELLPMPPGWFLTAFGYAYELGAFLLVFEAWLPMRLAYTLAGVTIGVFFVTIVIKIARTIVSYLTLGGGVT